MKKQKERRLTPEPSLFFCTEEDETEMWVLIVVVQFVVHFMEAAGPFPVWPAAQSVSYRYMGREEKMAITARLPSTAGRQRRRGRRRR